METLIAEYPLLRLGLLIGLFAGLISFIPYVGSLVGLVLSVGVVSTYLLPISSFYLILARGSFNA